MQEAMIGITLSAMATGMGAVPILFLKDVTHKWRDVLLAYAAGIMMAASTFSLIPEALRLSNSYVLTIGLLLGTFVLNFLEKNIPHIDLEHTKYGIKIEQKALLIVAAITLHNLPEGLSVGVSYAAENTELGGLIAFAIGLQNAPEGFLVALFLVNQNISKWTALLIATLTGAVEIVTGTAGFFLANEVGGLVPYGLSFAAGAMLFIIYKELIPESHGDGNERFSTYAFILGLITMLFMVNGL
ncbi:ZIP family metal transporter [Metabacillus fastidiosus]|uniref:ZIP family metal transporter n=1 Tax=Metabacillus fastidiosus TaxID=1458 RepID=A0ABU6NTD7_9BACI|nr:ZIP family metal transporter [Metabacillus fastidiosus]MED4400417.1 ZIP family metal transporter [Metabacillus fastidiosus]MED4454134.1 ZIP family metal transporter [Metabacillus fastidiosus]MED4464301.1 ZIP family metal transporter [Metabacillus fastidiosus]